MTLIFVKTGFLPGDQQVTWNFQEGNSLKNFFALCEVRRPLGVALVVQLITIFLVVTIQLVSMLKPATSIHYNVLQFLLLFSPSAQNKVEELKSFHLLFIERLHTSETNSVTFLLRVFKAPIIEHSAAGLW